MALAEGEPSIAPIVADDAIYLKVYLELITEHDRAEFVRMHADEPVPASSVVILFDDDPAVHESGFYMPDDGEGPRVFIRRPGFQDSGDYRTLDVAQHAPAPLRELLWLAHELGHHVVVLRGLGTGVRDDGRPTDSYTEEVLAWGFARRILQEKNFSNWAEFQRVAAESLRTYEEHFKLGPDEIADIGKRAEAHLASAGSLRFSPG